MVKYVTTVQPRGIRIRARATLTRWSPDDGAKVEVEGELVIDKINGISFEHGDTVTGSPLPLGCWTIAAAELTGEASGTFSHG
jgi:hypothetical protein